MRRTALLLASVAAALLLAGTMALVTTENSARAAFPGINGRIAFASTRGDSLDYNVFTMSFTGDNVRRLTSDPVGGFEPAYSPDGKKIAYVGSPDRQTDIYVMNADGSHKRLLTDEAAIPGDALKDRNPAFSPGGRTIVFARGRGDFDYDLYKINVDGSNLAPVFRSPKRDEQPAWSPDGKRIAFRYGNRIATVRPDGNALEVFGSGYEPDWSPDGTQLTFAMDPPGSEVLAEVYKMNADGTEVTQLTNPDRSAQTYEVGAGSPVFSPGGGKIAFFDGRDGDLEIFMMNADGTREIQLTHNKYPVWDVEPAWQPVQ